MAALHRIWISNGASGVALAASERGIGKALASGGINIGAQWHRWRIV
jgi:hypothetical protein